MKLENLVVPPVIQNGTQDHVILDCPYTLHQSERDGIVLKWYLNSKTVPIYQWIPPSHPQVGFGLKSVSRPVIGQLLLFINGHSRMVKSKLFHISIIIFEHHWVQSVGGKTYQIL